MIKFGTPSSTIFGLHVTKQELKKIKAMTHSKKLAIWYKITDCWSDGAALAFAEEINLDLGKR